MFILGEGHNVYIGSFCSIANNMVDWITTYPFGHINKNIFTLFYISNADFYRVNLYLMTFYIIENL